MSDLISRSGLYMNGLIRRKDVLALFPTNDCSDKMVGLYEKVLDIPTAYDVDKVVEEIKKSATDDDGLIVKDGAEPMIWKSKAVTIIRNGGIRNE